MILRPGMVSETSVIKTSPELLSITLQQYQIFLDVRHTIGMSHQDAANWIILIRTHNFPVTKH